MASLNGPIDWPSSNLPYVRLALFGHTCFHPQARVGRRVSPFISKERLQMVLPSHHHFRRSISSVLFLRTCAIYGPLPRFQISSIFSNWGIRNTVLRSLLQASTVSLPCPPFAANRQILVGPHLTFSDTEIRKSGYYRFHGLLPISSYHANKTIIPTAAVL